MRGEHAQRDARVAVVEAAPGERAVAVDDVDDAAGLRLRGSGFSTIFWKIHGWFERRSIFRRTTGFMLAVGFFTPP